MLNKRSWYAPSSPAEAARGIPVPENAEQRRDPPWRMVPGFGGALQIHTRDYSRGAAAWVSNFGTVFQSPIGAGIVTPYRPQASYGLSGQYLDHTIFWAMNTVPVSIPHQSLTSPQQLADLLGTVNVQAAMRVG